MSVARSRPAFVHSIVATFGANVGVAAISFVNVLIIARSLGTHGRGEYALLVAMPNLTHYLSTLGIQEANSNFAGRDPRLRPSLATNSVVAALVLGLLGAAAVEALVALVPAAGGGTPSLWRAIALGSVPFLILQNYLRRLAQADFHFAVTNVAWLLVPLVNVLVNGAFALAGAISVGSAVATWIAAQLAGTLLLVGFYGLRAAGFGRPDARLGVAALRFGIRAYAGDVMMIGNYRLDQWILGATRGASQLGVYSVAVALAETLFYLPEAVKTVVRPRLVRATRREAVAESSAYFRATLLLTAAAAAVTIVLAPIVVVTFFGDAFAAAAPQLRLLALGALGIVALKVLGNTLTAQRRPGLESAGGGAAFVLTLALDILLIPRFGGTGAAVASTTAYLFGGLAAAVLYARTLEARAHDLLPGSADLRRLLASPRRRDALS